MDTIEGWEPKKAWARERLICGFPAPMVSSVEAPYDTCGRLTKIIKEQTVARHKIFSMSFASIYPLYVQKVEKKSRTKEELNQVICWLTGYDLAGLEKTIATKVDLETFFARAPAMNPNVSLIKGLICGYRVEDIEDPLMQRIRYMDKLVDELAKGKKMSSILRN